MEPAHDLPGIDPVLYKPGRIIEKQEACMPADDKKDIADKLGFSYEFADEEESRAIETFFEVVGK